MSLDDIREHHVWALVVFMLVTGITAIVSIASYYGEIEDRRLAELIEQGQHPLELACLYRFDDEIKMQCFALYYARANAIEWGEEE